jgi:hypothetical protein
VSPYRIPQPGAQIPEYKRKQRDNEALANRIFVIRSDVKAGELFRDLAGRTYRMAPDGSWRRLKK